MISIKSKIILANLVVFGIVLIAFGFLIYGNVKNNELATIDSKLQIFATEFSLEFEEIIEQEGCEELSELFEISANGLQDVKFVLMDTVGSIMLSNIDLPEIKNGVFMHVLGGNIDGANLQINKQDYRDFLYPVLIDEQVTYMLRLISPLDEFHAKLNNLLIFLILVIPGTLLITAGAVYYVTKLSLKPLTDISLTAGMITGQNLGQRISIPKANDEIKKLADALNKMMERIEQAFESQRQFIAYASHELRTPLTVIYSELEYAKKALGVAESRESIAIACSEVDRLSRTTDQLLMLVKIDSGKISLQKQKIRLDELIADCIRLLNRIALDKDVNFNFQIEQPVELQADGEKLKAAVVNILENAIKYSKEKSTIDISLSLFKDQTNFARIEISDSGVGISESDLPRIFERFYRTEESGSEVRGSGLGLAIVKEIVDLHQGQIEVNSKENEGTGFIIRLPLN